jgi:uncharacterized protein with HEPN domain
VHDYFNVDLDLVWQIVRDREDIVRE